VSLDFLSPSPDVPASSPMEHLAREAGARFELRHGWNVAVEYPGGGAATGWADLSHLGKLELRRGNGELGTAERSEDAWWCPLTAERTLVIAEPPVARALRERLDAVDVTTAYAALAVVGPLAREVLARMCSIDLRPEAAPVRAFRPGSVARTPAMVLREAEDRFLVLFGSALGEYMWTAVADAATHLGGGPLGADVAAPEASHA
jgi:heterotetrameric sarcosine oxidase gamma subunit